MAADFYRPFIGGAERQSELLSRELAYRGYDVHLVTTAHPVRRLLDEGMADAAIAPRASR